MRFGVYVPTFGDYDVATIAGLARDAEGAGWDGLFIWDHLVWAPDGAAVDDATVALTAIALATERIRFGALITPLARRRPWKFAKETATLDQLSGGRLVAGVGLGIDSDFFPVGERWDAPERARRLDEGLDVVSALWTGEPVTHRGEHFELEQVRLLPTPVQRPRIPTWVAGFWPRKPPFRRAARWDGAFPLPRESWNAPMSAEEVSDCAAYVEAQRTADGPFDVVVCLFGARGDASVSEYEDAGATWLLDGVDARTESLADYRDRVRRGPRDR